MITCQNRLLLSKQNIVFIIKILFLYYPWNKSCYYHIIIIQCPQLNRITLGHHKSNNNNRLIQLTDAFCVLLMYWLANDFWLQLASDSSNRDPIKRRALLQRPIQNWKIGSSTVVPTFHCLEFPVFNLFLRQQQFSECKKQNWVDNLFRLINLPSHFLDFFDRCSQDCKISKVRFFRSQYYRIKLVLQIQTLEVSKFILQKN
jgi:hypothetical protein